MTFQDSIRTVVMQKYMDFSGRAPRSEFWWWVLAYVIGAIIVSFVPVLPVIYALALFLPTLAVGWRRMQDIGKPGWYFLIPSIYNLIVRLIGPRTEMPMDPETGMPMQMPGFGALAFGGLLGIVGLIIAVVFLFWLVRPGQPETNEYGPPPVR
ncbi:DUF805 domain-containing protein [Wenxinia marina]|uniref:Putative membrane protein n=1 Tax=Wenxinia marina DSM 24838 TaxID=1123501 RepID=A0A0D0PGL0_9RHOB|nr:DUF805 domain-containing protein [Wenxinia marina]KIQ70486.1 putative membrane protein [Wenxinia marina DSM 24838]GGL52734.1 hypothetical protein GCM10011392_03890 [Wenxinia marina]